MKKFILFAVLLCSMHISAQITFTSDQFDYVPGTTLSSNGWYIHSAGGANPNPIQVSATGLTWTNYIGSGVGGSAAVVNNGEDVNKPFSENADDGAVYASFLVNVPAAFASTGSGFFFHFGFYTNNLTPDADFANLSTAFRARTFLLQGTDPDTQFKLGLAFNATTAGGETMNLNIGETYLVVVKYEFIPGADNDQVSLYVFPQGADVSVEPSSPTIGPLTGTAADAAALQAVALRQYNANQNILVDGIFVKDVWELVPDCNGDLGGTAYLDACGICVGGNTGLEPCPIDCNGDLNGTAFLDDCDVCVGGNTGLSACIADCNGDFGGTAFLDDCDVCVEGNTGLSACVADCNGDFGGAAYLDFCNDCVGGNTGESPCPFTFLEEQFDYPAGDPLTDHGWFAHSAAGTNPILVHNEGLSLNNYLGSNIGNAGAVTNTGQDVNRPFSQYASAGDVYASCLVRVDEPMIAASEGFFLHFGTYSDPDNPTFTQLSTAFRGRTHIIQGTNSNQFKLGLSFNAGAPDGMSDDLNVGQTYLVVLKYQIIPGDLNDNVSLFIFEQGDDFVNEPTMPNIGPLTATPTNPADPLSPLASDATAIQAIALRQYNAAQEVIVDGIIVRNVWDIFGGCIPPAAPTDLACWQTATLNETTCEWEVSGTQPAEPTNLECWETTSFNNMTCAWEVSGTQPAEPTNLECWETTAFNNMTCEWEISGTQPTEPTNLECWQTASFNNTTCEWEVDGVSVNTLYQEDFGGVHGWTLNVSTGANGATANAWFVNAEEGGGILPPNCGVANNGNNTLHISCTGFGCEPPFNILTGALYNAVETTNRRAESPAFSTVGNTNITLGFNFISLGDGLLDNASVLYDDGSGWQVLNPSIKSSVCGSGQGQWTAFSATLPASCNNNPSVRIAINWTNNDDNIGTDPSIAIDNIVVTGLSGATQPAEPTNLACWETATFNNTTCEWEISGTQPAEPTNLECWETASFNNMTCQWEISGTQPAEPTNLECWETTSFNNMTCAWEVSGTQPAEPTNLECWETTAFNNMTCAWEVSGTQPAEPTNLECWETASFNNMTCQWDVTGTAPIPTFAAVGPYCEGASIPALPTTSLNDFEGTWSPAIDNMSTTTYTFTPDAGECASTATLTITIQSCGGNGPSNDEPCGALNITSSGQTDLNTYAFLSSMACNNQIGNNTNASAGAVGASCGGTNGGSMWYTFTTPMCDVGGNVPFAIEFSTNNAGTNFNTKLAIFESDDNDCNGVFTELACNDDHNGAGNPALCDAAGATTSTIVTNLQANKQYWVYVDGFNAEFGDFVLSGRALTAPHGAIATGGGTQIQLSTADMGAGLYTYYYKQVGSTGYSTKNSPTALTDTRTLAPGNDYLTQIMYRCGSNFEQSQFYRTEPQTITLENQCAIVNDMVCTFNGNGTYTLTWSEPIGSLFNDGGLSGYRIKRNPIGSTGVYTFSNPAVVCTNGTCSTTLPGNSPTGFNWTIETRCSANTVQIGNTTSCAPEGGLVLNPDLSNNINKSAVRYMFSFVNIEAGIEFVDVQMHDAYADFGLNTPLIGDYEIFVNENNEINWRRVNMNNDSNFDFVIVPNPSNAWTSVFLSSVIEEGSFSIVDAMGRIIQTGAINNTDQVSIDAAQLHSGVYLIVVTVGNQNITKRLIVGH